MIQGKNIFRTLADHSLIIYQGYMLHHFFFQVLPCWILSINYSLNNNWLTPRKGVHLFRYLLHSMRTPLWLFPPHAYVYFYCFVVYALSAVSLNAYTRDLWCTHWVSWHSMRTPQNNRNAYMYEEEAIKVVYALSAGNT